MKLSDLKIISKVPKVKTIDNPLVFVHGMFQGSFVYEEYFLEFFSSRGYECHLLNLRGHNGSGNEKSLRKTSISDYVEDLSLLVDSLAISPILIGHSMGGFIVQKYLEKKQVPLAILLAPVPSWGLYAVTLKVLFTRPHIFLKINLTWSFSSIYKNFNFIRKLMFNDCLKDELFEKFYPLHQEESYRAYMDMLLLKHVRVKKIKSPVKILAGVKDESVPIKQLRKMANKFNFDLKEFPDNSHGLMVETGWEQVAEHITSLLKNI